MTDPERLSKDSDDSLAALLLRAGAREKPSVAVLHRTSQAVAVAVAAVSAVAATKGVASAAAATLGTTASTGAKIGIGAVAQWVAIGAVGGAVAMSSLHVLSAEHRTEHPQERAATTAKAVASKPSQRSSRAAATVAPPVDSSDLKPAEPANLVEAQKARNAEPALVEPTKPEVPERTESALLAAEVRFVDQGRAALQRAAFAQAIDQLAPYEQLFPRQQLLTEVLFLRMESFKRLGNVERARALAARLLTLGVVGRQAAQAREVLGQ